jgi:MoaA/NifB/PqqE/SkfB family radical SAM enzyme/glycosyltransferase involved in cell wall biosynthesis
VNIALVTRGDLFPTNHGAAVKIVRTAEYLSLLGATVCVVTDDRDHYWRYERGGRSQIAYSARFRAAQEWPGVRHGVRWAERLCRAAGYPEEELFLYRAQFDPQWWARVLYVGRRESIDVFQAEFPGYGLSCWLAAKALGAQSSIVQHNVEWDRLQDVLGLTAEEVRHVRRLELWALEHVDHVIAVSDEDKQRMVDGGIDAGRITVIPHGVDTLRYRVPTGQQLRYGLGLRPEQPLLFFHGTLHYWPNTQAVRFIAEELMPRLVERVPGVHAVIAGLSPPTYYAHPAITFTGPVAELPPWIHAADLTLCPVPSGGGTRMKILEYFAAGKACVAFSKGAEGIRAQDGVEISLQDDPQGFADEVVRLLQDGAARDQMGHAARELVDWYDWTTVARRNLELYQGQGQGADYNADVRARRARGERPEPAQAVPVEAGGIDAHLPLREPSKPRTLLLLVNRGCNLRCTFCDLWDRPQNMPLDRILALLDEAQAIDTKTLVLTGGEPFMHPDLFTVVRHAKDRGMAVNITTNGTLIQKRWDELVASGVDSLSVSLDGLKDTHEALRGQTGCFTRTMKGVRTLRADSGIGLSVYFVVTNKNVDELVPVYELSQELGANFDFWPVNDAPDLYLTTPAHRAAYRDAVAHIAAREPAMATRQLFDAEGLAYHQGQVDTVRCLGLIDQYGVTYEGDLLPCCVWEGEQLKVGNVFETPLRELWVRPDVQAFRERMHSDGCAAGCFNHSLYEFTRSTGQSFRVDGPGGVGRAD